MEAVSEVGMADMRGKRLAIDTSIFMYKFLYQSRGDPISCFLRMIDSCERFSIVPIFVFDGMPCEAKNNELEKRREEKEKNRKKLDDIESRLQNFEGTIQERVAVEMERAKMKKRVDCVPSREHYRQLRDVLKRHGIKVVQAEGDAEKECVFLIAKGEADAVVSEDFDTLAYMAGSAGGVGTLITGFATPKIVKYDVAVILQKLELSAAQFIDTCILSGCDFSCKIQGIAVFRAFSLIKEHGTIEAVIDALDTEKYTIPDCFEYEVARKEFCCEAFSV